RRPRVGDEVVVAAVDGEVLDDVDEVAEGVRDPEHDVEADVVLEAGDDLVDALALEARRHVRELAAARQARRLDAARAHGVAGAGPRAAGPAAAPPSGSPPCTGCPRAGPRR